MDEKKAYYAVIPANVRYDKKLPANAKLLYGEITALCNEKGFCWASNGYFADLYEVHKDTISSWIGKLERCGYVIINFQYREGTKCIENRCISIVSHEQGIGKNADEYRRNHLGGVGKNTDTPIGENTEENITEENTTVNIEERDINTEVRNIKKEIKKSKIIPPDIEDVKEYCRHRNKGIDAEEWFDFYQAKGWMIGKNKMVDWESAVRTWERNRPAAKQPKDYGENGIQTWT